MPKRLDPFFHVEPPVIFAHRGGAGEVPESTEEAFRHAAMTVGVQVLELDIQVAGDGEIVVWHGPGLGNVHDGTRFLKGLHINKILFNTELKDRAWVAHPRLPNKMDRSPQRTLLTLKEFFALVNRMEEELRQQGRPRKLHLNIELKPGRNLPCIDGTSRWSGAWERLFQLLAPEAEKRRIILASARHGILEELRNRMAVAGSRPFVTNLSPDEQLSFGRLFSNTLAGHAFRLMGLFCFRMRRPPATPYALETYYRLPTAEMVRRVHEEGGALYVFLTGLMGFPSVDDQPEDRLAAVLGELVHMGVDGIMTDFPRKVMRILQEGNVPGVL
ncbi:MAG: hypothetical protein GX443_17940 [Deltaproteobacteria bacterium]|nr:hypothetical protein [Deltaproteobacteria bacterium]